MIVIKNEQQIIDAYERLPPKIQEAINATSNLEIIQKISRKYELSGDDEETLEMFAGFTLLGFIRPKDLLDEVAPILEVKEQTLVEILKEINREIFLPLHDDFQVLYQSQTSSEKIDEEEQETNLGIKIFEDEKKSSTETKVVKINEMGLEEKTVPISSDTPFILHEEKKAEMAGTGRTIFKGFSIPLGFFKSKNQPAESARPVRAEVEAPAKSEKRIVNYSELRTSLSPFEGQQGFINVGKPGEAKTEIPMPTPIIPVRTEPAAPPASVAEAPRIPEPAPATKPGAKGSGPTGVEPAIPKATRTDTEKTGSIIGTIRRPEPKIEGNTIDLR